MGPEQGRNINIMNKVMLIGNVGKEPEIRYMEAGVCVASLVMATTERGYKLQSGTEIPSRTEWHNVVLWRGLAETVEKYVHKGDKIYIEGKIHTRTYDDKNGIKRYVTEIWADSMELLSFKPAPAQAPAANSVTETTKDSALPF